MLRANSDGRFRFLQRFEACTSAFVFSPFDLFLDVVEEGNDIAETVLDINVAVGY